MDTRREFENKYSIDF